MAVLYIAAGVNHFRSATSYYTIMPLYVPYPYVIIYLTGIAESVLGFLLFFHATRAFAAWGIVALLVAVFPANVQMLMNYIHQNNPHVWVAVARLPIQLPLIWWAYSYTKPARLPAPQK